MIPTPAQVFYREWISNQSCRVCGTGDPDVLTNHHINPANKKYNIGRILTGGFSLDILRGELKKTIPVCYNCHTRIHKHYRSGRIGSLIPAEWGKKEWEFMVSKAKM